MATKLLRFWTMVIALGLATMLATAAVYADDPNGFTKPLEGAVVSGGVWIDGVANDSNFGQWQVHILFGGDEQQAALIAQSDQPYSSEGIFTKLDTTSLPNGTHRLRLRVVRKDGNYDEFFRTITIDNQASQVQNGITSPLEGVTVFGRVPIKGFADDPDFELWDLDLLLNGDERGVLSLERERVPNRTGDTFTTLDTTALPNGTHRLRLRVVRKDGNYDEFFRMIRINHSITPTPTATRVPRVTRTPRPPTSNALQIENRISSPSDGELVSGIIPVMGFADDTTFASWQLEMLLEGDPQQHSLLAFSKKRNKTGAVLTLLNTTALPDGSHKLRLHVFREDGTYDEFLVTIHVDNTKTNVTLRAELCAELRDTGVLDKRFIPIETQFCGWSIKN